MASNYDTEALINLLKNIHQLDDFYDAILVAGLDGKKFHVHKILMAAASRYFNALLGPNFKEAHQNEVVLNEIDGSTLKTIIDYCYCCKIEVNDENVVDIMVAASKMEFVTLAQQCESFYQSKLVCENFNRLSEADLVQMDQRTFISIIQEDMIDAPEDLIAYRFAQWLLHDPDNRKKYVPTMAKWIRLEHISEQAMSTVMKPFYMKHGCFGFVIAENRKRYRNKAAIILNRLSNKDRLYAVEIIYYDDTKNRIALHEFVEESKNFRLLYEVSFGGDVDNVVFLSGKLYVFLCDSVKWYSLDDVAQKIERLTDLPFKSHSSPVIVGNYFYLFHAFDPFATRSKNFARYDIKFRTWEYRKPFPSEFHDLSAIELNGMIYVAGEMPAKNFYSSNFWCYDPTNNSWTEKARINTIIMGGKHLIKVNNFICLINYNLETAMIYDADSNQWNMEWNVNDLKKTDNQMEERIYQTANFRGRTFGILSCCRKHYCVHLTATAKSCKARFISKPDFRWTDVGLFVYNSNRKRRSR